MKQATNGTTPTKMAEAFAALNHSLGFSVRDALHQKPFVVVRTRGKPLSGLGVAPVNLSDPLIDDAHHSKAWCSGDMPDLQAAVRMHDEQEDRGSVQHLLGEISKLWDVPVLSLDPRKNLVFMTSVPCKGAAHR